MVCINSDKLRVKCIWCRAPRARYMWSCLQPTSKRTNLQACVVTTFLTCTQYSSHHSPLCYFTVGCSREPCWEKRGGIPAHHRAEKDSGQRNCMQSVKRSWWWFTASRQRKGTTLKIKTFTFQMYQVSCCLKKQQSAPSWDLICWVACIHCQSSYGAVWDICFKCCFLFTGSTADTETNLLNILRMLPHSGYLWSCARTLNALLGFGNLTNCLGGWNLAPECLSPRTTIPTGKWKWLPQLPAGHSSYTTSQQILVTAWKSYRL